MKCGDGSGTPDFLPPEAGQPPHPSSFLLHCPVSPGTASRALDYELRPMLDFEATQSRKPQVCAQGKHRQRKGNTRMSRSEGGWDCDVSSRQSAEEGTRTFVSGESGEALGRL